MSISIVSVSAPTSATTGQEICPAVVVQNDGNELVRVAIAWENDEEFLLNGPDFSSQIELGPASAPDPVQLDLNGDGKVNVLDLTIAKNKLESGEWTQSEFDTWKYAYLYGTMPVRPSQGTIYPNPIEMPGTSVTLKLNLYKWQSGSGGYVSTGISKSISITNSGGDGGDGGEEDGGDGFWSKYGKWILIGGGALAAVGTGILVLVRRKK